MLPADPALEARAGGTAALDAEPHQLPYPIGIEHVEGAVVEQAR